MTKCMILAAWLVLSYLAGHIAERKGRSPGGFFMLALLLSPLVGIIAALAVSPNKNKLEAQNIASGEYRRCPFCAEVVRSQATVCPVCRRDMPAEAKTLYDKLMQQR